MPTPFYHLSIAEDLARHPGLNPMARDILTEHFAVFSFGNTAPDVQTVSGQDRRTTHFFDLPISAYSIPAWERFFGLYPGLTRRNGYQDEVAPVQAAFLAGYLSHLQADWFWVVEIFAPIFGPEADWQTPERRLYLHNVLRAYLDRQIIESLSLEIRSSLSRVEPGDWLPFVEPTHLQVWRDFLAGQCQPGARIQTVEVFASRQGISPDAYYQLLNSEAHLDAEIFSRLSRPALQTYRAHLLDENVQFLNRYLS